MGRCGVIQSAAALRAAGFDARYKSGGHYAWKAIKGGDVESGPTAIVRSP